MTDKTKPPVFSPEEDDDYLAWRNDIEVWKLLTSTSADKLGLSVYLALKGQARDVVRNIKPEELNKAEGYNTIIEELDKVYMKDNTTQAFCAFKEFYEFKRSAGQNFSEFIVEYDQRYHKIEKYEMKLPEGVQAFFLLKAANLTVESEKLARATAKLEYKDMREKLARIFGDPGILEGKGVAPEVKEEVFYGYENKKKFAGGGRGHGESDSGTWRSGSNRGYRGRGRSRGRPRCYRCQSEEHFVRECPLAEATEEVHAVEEANVNVHITLHLSQQKLNVEALGKGLLDSGCSKTVAGQVWYEEYLHTLSEEDRKKVIEVKSKSIFRFGDGVETKSLKCVSVPVFIGKKQLVLDMEIVPNQIPLLISKGAMKQLGMQLDFAKDIALIKGQKVKLICTSTGHYCLPLTLTCLDDNSVNFILHLECVDNLSKKEMMSKALKLHRQFSHATKEKLIKLLRDGGCESTEFLKCINKVCDECETCQKYRRAPLKPIVGLPIAYDFNQVVCMDLKEIEHTKLWILHLLDAATRYSGASLIRSKRAEVIINNVFQHWIRYFGRPTKFLSDNGGEFANEQYREMNEKLGVETATTAAESPFSNGTVERHNAVLAETMAKTKADTNCDDEMALAWACSSKNALSNSGGHSPNERVFGRNINLPNVLTDALPALEPTQSSQTVKKNLEAMHAARQNYIKAESSEKIRRALRHKVRTYSNNHFEKGEKVFYKRNGYKGWKGPATVIGEEGKIVLIRHGSAYYRCHPCHLMKVLNRNSERSNDMSPLVAVEENGLAKTAGKRRLKAVRSEDTSDEDDEDVEESGNAIQGEEISNVDVEEQLPEESVENISSADVEDVIEQLLEKLVENDEDGTLVQVDKAVPRRSTRNRGRVNYKDLHEGKLVEKDGTLVQVEQTVVPPEVNELDSTNTVQPMKQSNSRPKPNTEVQYEADGKLVRAKVLSVQPKRKGKNGNRVNIHVNGAERPCSINWDDVTEWREVKKTEEQVMFLTGDDELRQEVVDAKEKEVVNLIENDVFEEVKDIGQSCVSCKWVITSKVKNDVEVVKARLVARGFEERSNTARTDSPTCSRQSLRMSFVVASTMTWTIHSLDITSAFLQGNGIERNVFLRPPPEADCEGVVWKLKRCIYGLNDAPRAWYERVHQELLGLGGKTSLYDEAMFLWHNEECVIWGLIVIHVDDFIYAGTAQWNKEVIGHVMRKFKISAHASGTFRYVGLNVVQTTEGICIDQRAYVENLKAIDTAPGRLECKDEPLTAEEKSQLRSVSGQLLWATSQTRPDCAYYSCVVSNYGKEPTVRELVTANKAVKTMKSRDVQLKFPNLGNPDKIEVIVYSDASHANLPSGASQGGFIVFLSGNGKGCPFMWQSKKINRVTKSPLASETMELADAADAGHLTAVMVKEVFALNKEPKVTCFTDSKSLIDHLQTSHVIQDSRLRVDVARIKEMIELKECEVKWISNEKQLADPLTKAGASPNRLLEVLQNGVF